MSTVDAKPIKVRTLNPTLLPIAALLLVVLGLLFLAMPLIRPTSGFQRAGNFVLQTNGQSIPQNGLPGQSGSNVPNRQFAVRGGGFLSGMTGIIIYFTALLVSLAAAVGMFIAKRWGQVLGIIMAVIYVLLGLMSLLPIILMSFMGMRNPLSLILGIVHLLLAVAVIVLALIPAKKVIPPVNLSPPPGASA
jgi:hypothetical protein